MPTVTTRYVIYASRRRRHGGGGITEIQPSSNSALANGDTYQVPPSFPILPWQGPDGKEHELHFAFWSVVGGANGPVVTFGGQPSPSIPVGNDAIVATAWYIETGGGEGGDGTGIIIDAFDEKIGDFVFDDFVSVSPGDAAFNTNANWDGYVPTATAEAITAYNSIHGVPFDRWKVVLSINPSVIVSNLVANATAGSVAFAVAFYKPSSGSTTPGIKFREFKESTWVSWGVMVDGGGPTGDGPVGPWDPTMVEFAAGMTLMEIASKVNAELANDVMALAAKQVEMAAKAMSAKMKGKFNTRVK
jgi:hypothetical protein